MMKKTTYLLTTFLIINSVPVMAADNSGAKEFFGNIGNKIVEGFQNNAAKKTQQANDAKDYSGEVTFMNNQLKLDKAFTKRYNQLQPKESSNCHVEFTETDCPDVFEYKEGTDEVIQSKKERKKTLQEYEDKMMRARTLSELGSVYYCAKTAYGECHYVGDAGGVTKTVNGFAKFVNKAAEFFNRDAPIDEDWDVRDFANLNKDVSDETCNGAIDSAADTMHEYLEKLRNCEHIDQVTLSGYTDEDIKKLADKYNNAKENAQSKENRLLTGLTTAATGIGGMELAQGLAEQKADKEAEQSMSAYIATMRCKYAGGKQVRAGQTEIELPGGNDANIMKYRNEYIALADDLKTRKNALGLKPGIESEEILDKAKMGLYDDDTLGINDGAYSSLYRAQMYDSEKDKKQIAESKQTSKNRVVGGAVAAGVGVVGGIVGDQLINGKLGEKIKQARSNRNAKQIESSALNKLKQCLKDAGATQTNQLSFNNFTPSVLNLSNIDCKSLNLNGVSAKSIFADSTDGNQVCDKLIQNVGANNAKSMFDCETQNTTIDPTETYDVFEDDDDDLA